MRVRVWVGVFIPTASPAFAECIGGGCYDGLAQLVQAVVAYGLIIIVLLILLIVPRWRKAGVRSLIFVLAIAVGVPLVTQAWQRVQLWWMESGEVLGQPPAMTARTPLLIAAASGCQDDLCAAVVIGRGPRGVLALPLEALEGRDMASPLALAELPLEFWTVSAGGEPQKRPLTETERRAALARVDYLILVAAPIYRTTWGPLEAGLGLDSRVLLRLAMAPLAPGSEMLDMASLEPDILDLTSRHKALGVPLAPGNWGTLWSDPLDPDLVARSLCGQGQSEPDWACLNAAWH